MLLYENTHTHRHTHIEISTAVSASLELNTPHLLNRQAYSIKAVQQASFTPLISSLVD